MTGPVTAALSRTRTKAPSQEVRPKPTLTGVPPAPPVPKLTRGKYMTGSPPMRTTPFLASATPECET